MLSSVAPGPVLAAGIALLLAGCGGGGDSTTEETPSPEQKINKTVNKWAPLFAAGDYSAACKYQSYSLCVRTTCEHVGGPDGPEPIPNCTPPPRSFRKSFEDATVEDVATEGGRAGAKLSNGKLVEFVGAQPRHCIGSACPPAHLWEVWVIHRLGKNAGKKYFEP